MKCFDQGSWFKRRTVLYLFLYVLFVYGPFAEAGERGRSIGETFMNDLSITGSDAVGFFFAPLSFGGKQWVYTGVAIAGTVLAMAVDEDIRRGIGRNTTAPLNRDFWDIPTRYGAVLNGQIFSLTTYATGLFIKNDDIRITGRLMVESLAFSGAAVILVRYVAARSRPYSREGPWHFNGFSWDNEIQSFPSGHTTVAFALSTVLAERIDSDWARIGLYGIASLTAFARVYNNQHWFSDVMVGGGFGLLAGIYVVSMEREREREIPELGSRLSVQTSNTGLTLRYRLD